MLLMNHSSALQRTWLAKGSQGFMGAVWGGAENVRGYFSLKEENRTLAQDNIRLTRELERAKEEMRRIKAIDVSYADGRGDYEIIGAEIIKMSRNKAHNFLILNRGLIDGVKEHSGVMSPGGVVGIIESVSETQSFALSFQNVNMSISARLGTEGPVGPMTWDGRHSDGAILREIPLRTLLSPGDTVYTSGFSTLFPPDIPLGEVTGSKTVDGTSMEIYVRLFQDFKSVRWVSVVHKKEAVL